MDISQVKIRQSVWLNAAGMERILVVIVSLDPLEVRFPDGHIEEVFIDELEAVFK
jgi:hypothetical protein